MRIEVVAATAEDRPVLANLIQFYLYDFTDFKDWDVQEDGRFGDYGLDGCWTTDDRHPFLIRADGKLAGFAIVDSRSHLTGERGIWDVADFFVLRRYRKRGVGERAARRLFDRFRGRWEVRVMAGNLGAQAFWRTVIGRYTDGRFEEVQWHDSRWRGPVQLFDNSPQPITPAGQVSGAYDAFVLADQDAGVQVNEVPQAVGRAAGRILRGTPGGDGVARMSISWSPVRRVSGG
jgi:predicted acetyltransferase